MKKIIAVIVLVAVLGMVVVVKGGVTILVGSGITIPAQTTTNFSTLVQIGTFSLSPQAIYTAHAGISNTSLVTIYGYVAWDQTNKMLIPQTFQYTTTNPATGTLWAITNISFPVYGLLSVSNGCAAPITNFSAQLQY